MGKETKQLQNSSVFECKECGAVVKINQDNQQRRGNVPCPMKAGKAETEFVPEYCKNLN